MLSGAVTRSSLASRWTKSRHSSHISAVWSIISGEAPADQLQHEMATFTDAERQELVTTATSLQVSTKDTLAMKVDLILPWNKIRVWVKVAGDKGADTVKLVLQICNVPSPNSVQNTGMFAVFEVRDTTSNLYVPLDRYIPQMEAMMATKWR